ncbi:hypothetical protein C8Q75DRAFT_273038 [Abortiporus biennis]|nr:hypothetical protein C8Q75DRAFT_273038 [Abortiporus biennis]
MAEDSDSFHRENAILFQGSPISHLPTENIFEYATELKARPIALEWIDDSTCILVFSSRNAARKAHKSLMKFPSEEPSEEGFITSKPIPIALWPPEDRINKSLGMSEGLKGIIRMRWATKLDVKKKGAKQQSQFYKKYGRGRDEQDATGPAQKKRRGEGGEVSDVLEKAQLDDDLDAFLAEGEEKQPSSKPAESKMRSDYIAADGRTLLERTSDIRVHSGDLESRIGPSRRRRDAGGSKGSLSDRLTEGGHQKSRGRGREGRGREKRSRTERPRKTQEDLDAELDAFLNGRD